MQFFEFQLKVAGVLALGVLVYYLFLSKDMSFNRNRLWLLSNIIVPWIVPLLAMPVAVKEFVFGKPKPVAQFIFDENLLVNPSDLVIVEESMTWQEVAWWLFAVVSLLLLIRVIISYASILKISKGSEKGSFKGLLLRLLTQTHLTPFSFLRTIYAPKGIYNHKNYNLILEHEAIHCKQLHSLDIILAEILLLFQWWNPFAWWLKKLIAQNHEYIVDSKMMQRTQQPEEYQYMLVDWMKGNVDLQLVHNFNSSFIKKRIVMMNHNKSNNLIKKLKIAPVLLLVLISVLAFTNPDKTVVATPIVDSLNADIFTTNAVTDTISKEVEVVIISDEEEDVKSKVKKEVKTIVTVIADGKHHVKTHNSDSINVEVIQLNDADSIVVVTNGDKELHGKHKVIVHKGKEPLVISEDEEIQIESLGVSGADAVKKVVIIKDEEGDNHNEEGEAEVFVLHKIENGDADGIENQKKTGVSKKTKVVFKKSGETVRAANPLFIVDDVEVKDFDMQQLPPDEIESIDVLKGETAVAKYGEKGKDGVVVIHKKKPGSKGNTSSASISKTVVKKNIKAEKLDNALIFVDGVEMSNFSMKSLNPEQIKSISVLKDAAAIAQYGEKGKNGVILIKTKSGKEEQSK